MSRFELLKAACTFKDTPAKAVWSPPRQPPSRPLVERRYRYDKAGNLISSTDLKSGTTHYRYDPLDRILEAAYVPKNTAQKFAFAPVGNILDDLTQNAREGGLYRPDGNRIAEFNGIEYTYDALGNLIYRQLPNGENQYYQYDLENQLVRAEIKKPTGNTEIWTYAYDPFGRRLSKERQDKLAWTSTEPKRTHFVWDGTRLLQEYTYKGSYTYLYTDQDSYEPLAQVFDNAKDGKQYLAYFHTDQIGIPKEMTDIHGNLLWYGEYTAWGRLKKDERVYRNAHQPFRLQNQYYDEETGLHYNLMRYYEPEAGRFVNQDPIGLLGGINLYQFSPNVQTWIDPLGLNAKLSEMAQSVHNLAGGLKTPDARAIEKSTVAIFEVELKNGSKTLYAAGSSGRLNPRQRSLLEKLGVPKENILSGKKYTLPKDVVKNINHAEQIILRNIPDDAKVTRKGISWGSKQRNAPCSRCKPSVDGAGGVYD